MSMQIGIDLGGTKIEVIVLDAGRQVFRERVATPREDYAATLQAIADLVARADQCVIQKVGAGETGVSQSTALRPANGPASGRHSASEAGTALPLGVGIPGAESLAGGAQSGRIKNANSTCLIGHPLRADLEARLQRPVRLANDANCFALSEATDGAGAGAAVVFGVILGTGVGGGIVVNGQLLTGANAIAGEWGHNPLSGEHHKTPCYCGRKGCIETYLSGPALAAAGGADSEAAMQHYEARLARALAGVINILDPDVIVLGGGVSNLDRLYANVPRLWGPHVFSDTVATRLVKHHHGDSSGVRGAAWLWGRAA